MALVTATTIINRALQRIGSDHLITSLTEDSKQAVQANACYDTLRRAELRRNIWSFAVRRCALRALDTTTMRVTFIAWDTTVNYPIGSVVSYSGVNYQSVAPDNQAHTPGSDSAWQAYFGPLCATPYDSTISYFIGEMVYVADDVGNYNVYISLANSNDNDPATADAWSATTTYGIDQIVSYAGALYQSFINFNLGNQPDISPDDWAEYTVADFDAGTTYTSNDSVFYNGFGVTSGAYFHSQQDTNLNNTPSLTDDTWWFQQPVLGNSSGNWLLVACVLNPMAITYPLTAGPLSDTSTRNAFPLPAGFLRIAPQMPKQGSTTALGAPTNLAYSDWEFDGGYIVSTSGTPIQFRFVADVTDPALFDPMFIEGFASRLAFELCEPLTQSSSKLASIGKEYGTFMSEARLASFIEQGPVESDLDDYLLVRF